MKVLITGGCGFIGSNMVEFHLNQGDEVHAVDNLSSGSLGNIAVFTSNPKFQYSESDILTWSGLAEAVSWADRVYNFAAVVGVFKAIADPMGTMTTGILGCHHLLQTIADSKKKPTVVLASSSAVYGDNSMELLSEEGELASFPPSHPLAAYGASKLCDEILGNAYYNSAHIPIVIPRMFNTIGPRQISQYGMVVPRFVQQAINDKPLTIFGDGTQTRSFCDVRDTVVMLSMLADCPKAMGQIVNVGLDVSITINKLAELVEECFGKPIQKTFVPYSKAYGKEFAHFTDVKQRRPDLSKLRNLINFKHKWSIKETIMDLIQHYKNS
jgi:UDP-glucose 4-epimerase